MKWELRFLELARHLSTWSKDPSTQVGAVIVDAKRRIVGVGYNGFPRGVFDDPTMYHNRELKYEMIVHGEVNAILNSTGSVEGCTLYTWPFMPCSRCAAIVINAGITSVVTFTNDDERWAKSFELSRELFEEAGVELTEIQP